MRPLFFCVCVPRRHRARLTTYSVNGAAEGRVDAVHQRGPEDAFGLYKVADCRRPRPGGVVFAQVGRDAAAAAGQPGGQLHGKRL